MACGPKLSADSFVRSGGGLIAVTLVFAGLVAGCNTAESEPPLGRQSQAQSQSQQDTLRFFEATMESGGLVFGSAWVTIGDRASIGRALGGYRWAAQALEIC